MLARPRRGAPRLRGRELRVVDLEGAGVGVAAELGPEGGSCRVVAGPCGVVAGAGHEDGVRGARALHEAAEDGMGFPGQGEMRLPQWWRA